MGLFSSLEKLTIKKKDRGFFDSEFECMFNPANYSITYENQYAECRSANTTGKEQTYSFGHDKKLDLKKVILDNTGVAGYGAMGIGAAIALKRLFGTYDVYERVQELVELVNDMDGDTHAPNVLEVQWGDLSFEGVMEKMSVKYTLFDSSGSPLRAEIDFTFKGSITDSKRIAKEGKSSPDLTHVREVPAKGHLPLMAHNIYKDSSRYIHLAHVNKLNNFRKLKAGTSLKFPPVRK